MLAIVGIQVCGLSFRCIGHLESGFCLLCTSHGSRCLSPNHQVWKDLLHIFVSAFCGGIWIQSWEEASHVQDLCEDFPAFQRHSVRLHARQRRNASPAMSRRPVGFPEVTRRVNSRHQVGKIQSRRIVRSLTNPRPMGRSKQTTICGIFSRTCPRNTEYGDSFKSKMQSTDDEKAALLAAKRQFQLD